MFELITTIENKQFITQFIYTDTQEMFQGTEVAV
jgi:hypothetical protein